MNKPRLIDANKLIKDLEYYFGDNKWAYTAKCLINDQPTPYDIDKVVEQLCKIEVHRSEHSEIVECNIEPCRGMSCYECILDKAIEIAKGGAE